MTMYQIFPWSLKIGDTLPRFKFGEREKRGKEHDGLCKDDGHYACCIHFERQELARTTKLAIANNLFCVVNRDLSCTLNKKNESQNDCNEHGNLNHEDQQTTTTAVHLGSKFLHNGKRQFGKDTHHNNDGSTITQTLVLDLFSQPHHEQGTCRENDHGWIFEKRNVRFNHRIPVLIL